MNVNVTFLDRTMFKKIVSFAVALVFANVMAWKMIYDGRSSFMDWQQHACDASEKRLLLQREYFSQISIIEHQYIAPKNPNFVNALDQEFQHYQDRLTTIASVNCSDIR